MTSVQPYLPRTPRPLRQPIVMPAQSAQSTLNCLWATVSGNRGSTQILQELLILHGSALFPGRE